MMKDIMMVMPPKVSIVIPIFNAAPFLHRCLDSALCQTFTAIEIIGIDDASSDGSLEILEDYAARDGRIKIIRNGHNRGTFATRARGVLESSGEYVLNLDADDELFPDILEKIYPLMEAEAYDILHFRMKNFSENPGDPGHFCGYGNPEKYVTMEGSAIAMAMIEDRIHHTPWAKLIRREVYQMALRALHQSSGILNERIICYEDLLHMTALAIIAKKYRAIETVGYRYISHKNSVMASWRRNDEKILAGVRDICKIVTALDRLLERRLPELREAFQERVQWRAISWAKRPRLLKNALQALQIIAETKIFTEKTCRKIKTRLWLKYAWCFWRLKK